MAEAAKYSVAIETSSRRGGVALGRGDELLAVMDLPPGRRNAVELMPAIDRLCAAQKIRPGDIGEVYVSIGPGSFTGLRVGITTAKLLGRSLGAKLVGVPTLEVIVQNAPPPPEGVGDVAVLLNAKRGQCFTGLFAWEGGRWVSRLKPSLLTPEEVLARTPRPLAVVSDCTLEVKWPEGVRWLDPELARPRGEAVWRLGRARAQRDAFTDPMQMVPLYVRLPEAEEVWQAKHEG